MKFPRQIRPGVIPARGQIRFGRLRSEAAPGEELYNQYQNVRPGLWFHQQGIKTVAQFLEKNPMNLPTKGRFGFFLLDAAGVGHYIGEGSFLPPRPQVKAPTLGDGPETFGGAYGAGAQGGAAGPTPLGLPAASPTYGGGGSQSEMTEFLRIRIETLERMLTEKDALITAQHQRLYESVRDAEQYKGLYENERNLRATEQRVRLEVETEAKKIIEKINSQGNGGGLDMEKLMQGIMLLMNMKNGGGAAQNGAQRQMPQGGLHGAPYGAPQRGYPPQNGMPPNGSRPGAMPPQNGMPPNGPPPQGGRMSDQYITDVDGV